jgi:hypothetical protein
VLACEVAGVETVEELFDAIFVRSFVVIFVLF